MKKPLRYDDAVGALLCAERNAVTKSIVQKQNDFRIVTL